MIANQLMDLANVTVEDFKPLVGESFDVYEEGHDMKLTSFSLHEVVQSALAGDKARPFSLFFSGPAEVALQQSIYSLKNPQVGVLDLFVVPVAGDSQHRSYQAVFN